MVHPRAGQIASATDLISISDLKAAYFDLKPDAAVTEQKVSFGTSGHRGSSFNTSFNENHILAIHLMKTTFSRLPRPSSNIDQLRVMADPSTLAATPMP